jgi:hypothetical protein
MPRSPFNLSILQSPRFRSWLERARRARAVRPLKIAGVLYLGYLALMTLVAMPALNLLAPRLYHAETGRELRLDKIILLNPFTLSVTVRNAASDNPDHSRFWAFDRLHADVALSSLWRRQLVLDLVQLQGLYLQVDQTDGNRYNFSDILDYRAARGAPEQPGAPAGKPELFPVSIERIELDASHLGLRAPRLAEPLSFEIAKLAIGIDRFSTVALSRSKEVTLEPTEPALDIEVIAPLHTSAIAIGIGHVKADFLRSEHPFAAQLDGVQFNMEGFTGAGEPQDYQLRAAPHAGGELRATGRFDLVKREHRGEIHVDGFNLLPAWHYLAPRLAFETKQALLDADVPYRLQWGDKLRYFVDNGRVALRDAQLQSQRDADTQIGVKTLSVEGIGVDGEKEHVHIKAIRIDGLMLHGWNDAAQVSLRDMLQFKSKSDASTESNWQIGVDELTAQHSQMRWRTDLLDVPELVVEPLDLNASNINWPVAQDAKFTIKTRVNNDTQLAVEGVLNLANRSGKVSGDIGGLPLQWGNRLLGQQINAQLKSGTASARFDLALDKGQPITLRSDGRIDKLELQRLPDQQKLAAWQRLEWKKLAVNLPAQKLRIEQIVAVKPWLAFRLNPDGTNNFQTLTAQKKVTPPLPEPAKTKAAKQQPAASEKPWLFTIRNIHTENGLLDFRDASLSRTFHATIADFTGDIEGLSNRDDALAKIAFKGTVDGYAPVALTGTANPFATQPALDVTLDIANLDLSTLTPYSGTYAGYLIDGGRLSVQLAYTMKDGRIQGSNHIVVNQLKLGEQVRGPKVMDLPLRFAIYLLTDSNGVMDLGVDVTGNVDDPDFSVASIIWKAFRNVIVKTATSPFRALGRLVKGADEDLDRIAFPPGSDRIVDADNGKLNSLSEALQKKDALRLNISGHVSPGQDIEGLRDNSLSADLIAQSRITATDIQQQSTGWQDAVAKLYRKRFPADTSGKLSTMQMNDSMRDNVELDPRALDELAGRRALAVKQALVADRGLAPERAAIAPVDLGTDKNPGLHATMTLE